MGTTSGKQVQTAKGKHKFFAWLLVQSKFLTADSLLQETGYATQFALYTIKSLKQLLT